jgi:hypothetical protein
MFEYVCLHPRQLKRKLRVQFEPKFHQAVWLPIGSDIEILFMSLIAMLVFADDCRL